MVIPLFVLSWQDACACSHVGLYVVDTVQVRPHQAAMRAVRFDAGRVRRSVRRCRLSHRQRKTTPLLPGGNSFFSQMGLKSFCL